MLVYFLLCSLIPLLHCSQAFALETFRDQKHSQDALPVVIWHGLGDNYQNPGLVELADDVTAAHNVSVHLIHLADEGTGDQRATFFGRALEQVSQAAAQLRDIPELANGYDAVGLSQGGQLLRALAEYYPDPPMRNLVTVGSQHMGIADFPECRPGEFLCLAARWALRSGAWQVQNRVVPAQYYRNQASIAGYLQNSAFLREINNERWGDAQVGGSEDYLKEHHDESGDQSPRNQTIRENFTSLSNFVMMGFSDDRTVVPWTSSYFALLNTTDQKPIPRTELPLYKDDYLGLRALDDRGAVHEDTCRGEHMQIDKDCWNKVLSWLGPQTQSPNFVVQFPPP